MRLMLAIEAQNLTNYATSSAEWKTSFKYMLQSYGGTHSNKTGIRLTLPPM